MFFENGSFTEKSVYNIIIIVFMIIGVLYLVLDKHVPQNYAVICLFLMFKMLFNYKKCTISYLECKIRKVKREDGILGSLLDYIVDLRDHNIKYFLYLFGSIFVLLCIKEMVNLYRIKFKNMEQ